MDDGFYKPGDFIRITIYNDFDSTVVRNLVVYEHRPQSIADRSSIEWYNNFYRYLDLDTGEVKIGYIASSSNSVYLVERL